MVRRIAIWGLWGVMVCGLPGLASGTETGRVEGRVRDAKTGEGLPGATVGVEGTKAGAGTDDQGRFLLPDLPPGGCFLVVRAIGYETARQAVAVGAGETVRVEVVLTAQAIEMGEGITVEGDRPYTTASSETVRKLDFDLRPRRSAQDLLRMAPGLVIAQHAGGGKAEQVFLRGFDADHGTDVALSVDGMPVNMVSHAHGQGYADLHFLIPEVVQRLDLIKGPYSPAQGDFATAGAVAFTTADRLERSGLHVEGGRFGTARVLGLYQAPATDLQSAYVAGEIYRSNGPFERKQGFNRLNVFGKFRAELSQGSALSFDASGFGAGWDASGQVPERAVQRGVISRFGSIDPTEGGTTQRHHVNLTYRAGSEEGDRRFLSQAYFIAYRFRLFSNFTFFANDPVNGDGIEQDDARRILGFRGEYALRGRVGQAIATTTFGAAYRADNARINLWRASARRRLGPQADVQVHQQNAALFGQEEVVVNRYLRLQAGVRADYFLFDVDDALDDLADPAGPRGSGYAQQVIVSPKLNVVLTPTPRVDVYLNAGTGFHSNDARDVVLHPGQTTLPRMVAGEAGARGRAGGRLDVGVALWRYDLEREFVYVGDEGTTEESGATRRIGVDLEARLRLLPWLWGDWDVTLSRGRFKEAPAGEDRIPLAPTRTSAGGLTLRHPGGFEGSLRVRHVGDRPANEPGTVRARGYTLADLSVGYRTRRYLVGLTAENLLNAAWNEAQFDTASRLRDETGPVSELHFTPGSPVDVRIGVSCFF